ncbi:MAG: hypothetical protein JXR71_11690 [Bacteroidales bacterium]|nr:hypothetical protein [Bacteroidales bacterium]
MKKQRISTKLIVTLIFLLGIFQPAFASEPIVKVLADKQFKVEKGVVLNATQEFGKVYCKNWEKPEISVKITARITGDADQVDKILSRIVTQVSGDKSEVTALCKLSSSITKMIGQHVELVMEIMMPDWVNLNLEHSFGAAWVGNVSGNATLKSKYGSLSVGSITGQDNKIDVRFGKGDINTISNANIELSYGKMTINNGTAIILDGEYSDLQVQSLKTLKADMEGGRLSVGSVDKMDGESSFTDVSVDRLSNSIKWNMNYGGISVDQVEAGFAMVSLNSDFGTTRIGIAPGATATLNVAAVNGSITVNNSSVSIKSDVKEMLSRHIEGILGNKKNPAAEIVVKSNYGTVKIN